MSTTLYIANDLSGLLLKYIEQHSINAPDIQRALTRFQRNTNTRLGYERWCSYINQLGEMTDNPGIGIDIGELMEPAFCGVLGHLALSCGTVAEAFARFARYQQLLYEGAGEISIVGDKYRFYWSREHEEVFDTQQSDEILLVGLLRLSKHLSGNDHLKPFKVGFMHSAPNYAPMYEASLGSNIEYNQPHVFVELTVDLLSNAISDRNPTLITLLDQQAEAMLRALPDKGEFDIALRKTVIKCLQNGTPSLSTISNTLNISGRTLHRRLENRGLNFGELLQRIRSELAIQYLRERQLSIIEISFLLGYSEQSAFSRAFKQWTGKTPGKFQ